MSPTVHPPRRRLALSTSIDAAYLLPLKVTLASLRDCLSREYEPVLYLLNRGLDERALADVSSIVETHSIVPSESAVRAVRTDDGFVPEVTLPLLLPELVPDSVSRILFLDPDLLVTGDVAELWETDLGDCVVAAVIDQAIRTCGARRGVKDTEALGIPRSAPYFNAGVLLIDVARWKREDVSRRAQEYMNANAGRTDFVHQEALNAVLWNRWLRLDQKWNMIASLSGRGYGPYKGTDVEQGIIHFAGRFKPWRIRTGGPFSDTYEEVLARHSNQTRSGSAFTEKILSIYDRYLRSFLYPVERTLWQSRLI